MDTPDAGLQRVAERLRRDFEGALGGPGLANPEGWLIVDTRVFPRWVPVVELRLTNGARTLCFIVAPADPEQPAFKRGARYDIVYYSDDLAVAEHEGLYARDRESIERIARWLVAWDAATQNEQV
ncbi:MAG: hypothetical protein R3F39_23075 [Myxococcota bacterium]